MPRLKIPCTEIPYRVAPGHAAPPEELARARRALSSKNKKPVLGSLLYYFFNEIDFSPIQAPNSLFLAHDGSKNAPIPKIFGPKKFLWKVIIFISTSEISVYCKKLKKIENEKMPKIKWLNTPLKPLCADPNRFWCLPRSWIRGSGW